MAKACELKSGQHTITRQTMGGGQDVSRLLTSKSCACKHHCGMHVLVTNRCPIKQSTASLPSTFETQVRHHRGDQALVWQMSPLLQGRPPEVENVITIDNTTLSIDRKHAVGIPIECEAHDSAALDHRTAQRLKVGGPTFDINPGSIWIAMQHRELGPKCRKNLSTTCCCRPPAEIKHDWHTIKPMLFNAGQQTGAVVIQQLRSMMSASGRRQLNPRTIPHTKTGLNCQLPLGRQLAAIGPKHLDPVVLRRVVARRNH
jgi:hypothetical protein